MAPTLSRELDGGLLEGGGHLVGGCVAIVLLLLQRALDHVVERRR
jgi:hypothetical protein